MKRLASLCWVVVIGCGGSGGGDTPDASGDCPTTGRFLALSTGRSWTYKVTDTVNHTVAMKTQSVGALEPVVAHPGVQAFKLTTTKPGGSTDSWQEDTGTEVRRHAENDNSGTNTTTEVYDPYKIRIDESPDHVLANASFTIAYDEIVSANGGPAMTTAKTEDWTIVAVDEMVDVPAGTFCALHIHRTSSVGGAVGSTKDFWFTRGVGKVKEVGDGQTEELSSVSP